MARDGSPDDPNYSDSDPTQYANLGGTGEAYSEYQQSGYGPPTGYGQAPPPEPTPWHRKPAALIGLGVLTAVVLAFLVYAVVKFTGSGDSGPAGTSTTSSTSSSAAATTPSESVVPGPGGTTQTVTESPSSTAEAPTTTTEAPTTTTTTEAPSTSTSTSTSTSVSTSVSTVTETITSTKPVLPTLPTLFPKPGQ